MKYQYTPPPNCPVATEDIIADIKSVSSSLNGKNITINDYTELGKYSHTTVKKRFGNWNNAKIEAGLAVSERKPKNAAKEDLIADLKIVSSLLNQQNLSYAIYSKLGKYSKQLFKSRFGNWNNAKMVAGLAVSIRKPANHINRNATDEDLIGDLKRVSSLLNQPKLSYAIYSTHGKYSKELFKARFRTWNKALRAAGLELAKAGQYKNEELFANLLTVWQKKGKQPVKLSFDDKSLSSICATVYTRRFGSIEKALKAFIQFISSNETQAGDEQLHQNNTGHRRASRDPSLRLRYQVLIRDKFTCKVCGNSPAKDSAITLHVDHIEAWSNGGDTVIDNLQVLCSGCNLGKSNL
jgi:hypothetical protein